MNLVYIRRVGYGARSADELVHMLDDHSLGHGGGPLPASGSDGRPQNGHDINLDALRQVLRETIRIISAPERN